VSVTFEKNKRSCCCMVTSPQQLRTEFHNFTEESIYMFFLFFEFPSNQVVYEAKEEKQGQVEGKWRGTSY